VSDEALTLEERDALHQFSKTGVIRFLDIASVPLMLNATKAAELLGVSSETFKKIRDQAAAVGVTELCGVELTPGNFLFSRVDLVRLSQGEFRLHWSPAFRQKHSMATEAISSADAGFERAG
jgi:hypothetical protein